MRSAKDGNVLERPSSINATNPRGPQQEGSRADRQGVDKTPRRPFSRGSLICIIIRHSGETTTRTPKPLGHQDPHTLTSPIVSAHTVANIMCITPRPPDWRQMALKAKIARNTQLSSPSKNRRRPMARHQKKKSTIQHVCLSSQDQKKKTSTQIGLTTTTTKTQRQIHRSEAHHRDRTRW